METLRLLKDRGYKLVLVSNLATPYKEPYYRLGLDQLFDYAVFSDEAGMRKADPNIYHKALGFIATTPQQAVFIGDHTVNDVEVPVQLGMRAYLCRENSIREIINAMSIGE